MKYRNYIIIVILSVILCGGASAQNENAIWLYGNNIRGEITKISFQDTGIVEEKVIKKKDLGGLFGNHAVYSDPVSGELLLFSGGIHIYV